MPTEGKTQAADSGDSYPAVGNAEEFRLAAIHLFGRIGWKKNTALAFGVTESTVYRWVNENVPIPHYAASAMGAWLIVFELTGKRPPQATDHDDTPQKPKSVKIR
jgi:hypothetical protein